MFQVTESVYVSLAYRMGSQELGGNWQIELASRSAQVPLRERLSQVKGWIDHRCLWMDLEDFKAQPSTPEAVAVWLQRRLADVSEVGVHESKAWCFVAQAHSPLVRWRARVHNLWVEGHGTLDTATGLIVDRAKVAQCIGEVASKLPEMNEKSWCEQLYRDLEQQVPGLLGVRVDLSRQRFIEHRKT